MRSLPAICLILLSVSFAFAQGEDPGAKKPMPKPVVKTPAKPPVKAPVKTPVKTTTAKTASKPKLKPKPAVTTTTGTSTATKKSEVKTAAGAGIAYGGLNIVVSEPSSEVFLSDEDGNVLDEDSYFTEEDGSPMELEDVPTGSYRLVVRKYGFLEESKQISVAGGKINTVTVVLRPSGAMLTVRTNVEGANIEIVGAGEFQTGAANLMLEPGKYKVNVYKTGYLTENREIHLTSSGQKQQLDISLTPFPLRESLVQVEKYIEARDLTSAQSVVRKILGAFPEDPRANFLAGLSSMTTSPEESGFFLGRAIGFGENAVLPARRLNKDDAGMQLIPGSLTINSDSIQFRSPDRPDLNFTLTQRDALELSEKTDEFGLTQIVLKGRGEFNGKADRRTVTLYSSGTAMKPSRKELFCPVCAGTSCPCRSEERVIYALVNRWKNRDFFAQRPGFGTVLPPSEEFIPLETANFLLRTPENWQLLSKNDSTILVAPRGGFAGTAENTNFSHGFELTLEADPNQTNLSGAHDQRLQNLVAANSYLERGTTSGIKLQAGSALVTALNGVSPNSQRRELVMFYTVITPNRQIFYLTTVIPPHEAANYEGIFRRVLNSISLK